MAPLAERYDLPRSRNTPRPTIRRPARGGLIASPYSYPALMAGAIWVPGQNEQTAHGDRYVQSGATQQSLGTRLITEGITGDVPTLATAGNGAAYWSYAGLTYPSLAIPKTGALGTGPGADTCLQWVTKGSYAGWFKTVAAQDALSHILFSGAWGTAGQSRIQVRKNLGVGAEQDRLVVEVSWTGTVTDGPPGERCKWNSPVNVADFTQWLFVRVTIDMTAANYQSAGANKSYRLRVWINEVEIPGTFSAPNPATGGDPPDGPIHTPGPWPSTSWFSLGADGISNGVKVGVGPFYAANGVVPEGGWPLIMTHAQPGD